MTKLKKLRKENNFKQIEVAKATGISQQAYSYFERGTLIPSLDTAKKIANFYNMTIEDIFFNN